MLKITSRDNQRLKNVRKIRDGQIKESIFIEGLRLTEEAFRSNLILSEIFFSESFFANTRSKAFVQTGGYNNVKQFVLLDNLFKTITATKSSQGIILIAEKPQNGKAQIESNLTNKKSNASQILLLNDINNPSNLGAILRTAEASGVLGVIITKSSAKVFSPKALRGAMGACFRIPVWENADFTEAINWAKQTNLTTVCADINSELSYLEVNWDKDYLIVFGSESHGLSDAERTQLDQNVFIPMENEVESLNLAVSCGIILFEAKRKNTK